MKKRIFKTLIFIALIFSFNLNIKADLNCLSAPKHDLSESIESAEFDTLALVCSWSDGPLGTVGTLNRDSKGNWKNGDTIIKPTNHVNPGIRYAEQIVSGEVGWISASNDGKDVSAGSTAVSGKRCSSPNRTFVSKVSRTRPGCKKTDSICCDSDGGLIPVEYDEPATSCDDEVESKAGCQSLTCTPADNGCPGSISTTRTCELKCPTASCVMTYQQIGACTASFTTEGGYRAWCVNPSQKFGSSYNEDLTFDPSKCANSYSTTDCGYANILVESEHIKQNNIKIKGRSIDYKIIELALRLWGAHSKDSGYVRSGLAVITASPGTISGVCGYTGDNYQHLSLTAPPNVYKTTEKYIIDNFMKYVSEQYKDKDSIDYVKLVEDGKLYTPCELGLTCGTNEATTITYKFAYALFFNTLFGNPNMKKHLMEYFGISTAPIGIELSESKEGETQVEVNYGEYKSLGITPNVEFNCDEVLKSNMSDAEKQAILPFCQTKIVYVDYNGNETTVMPDICKGKNSLWCTSKPIKSSICNVEKKYREIKIKYPDKSYKRIVKMINCGTTDRQIMYSIFPGKNVTGGENTIPFTIPSYNCNGNCSSSELRKKSASCEYKVEKNDGEVSTGFVRDPSLNCILNLKSPREKEWFDYSKEFGINTNYCKIYCSDEVNYYIPDKLTIKGGLAFKYDIAVKSYLNKTDNHLISNVVKSKRNCVSEINYNKGFEDAFSFENLFGLNESIIKTALTKAGKDSAHLYIENWKDLYEVIKYKDTSAAKNRLENVNELLYDIYNCNLFGQSVFDKNEVTRPKQRVIANENDYGNAWEHIKKTYSTSNNYGFNSNDCTINSSTNTCITMNNIEYSGGSEITSSTFIGKDSPIKTNSVNTFSLSEVRYCSGYDCFSYDPDYLPNSAEDIATYDYSNINRDSGFEGKVPTNDYAMFSIETEVGFYNASTFQTVQSIGYVKPVTSSNKDTKLIDLEIESYPTSKNAYTTCNANAYSNSGCSTNSNTDIFCDRIKNSKDQGPTTNSSCKVTHNYSRINVYNFRHDNDRLLNEINTESDFTRPSCYIDVEPSQPQVPDGSNFANAKATDVLEYRNINRSDMFPNDEGNPKYTNWDNENAIIITQKIEEAGNYVYARTDNLQYSFTITPEQIKEIRRNNRNIDSYVNIELTDCQIIDGMYQNCRSTFLDEIRSGTTDTSESLATVNDGFDGSDLFYQPKEKE